jgi:hypothetical protein
MHNRALHFIANRKDGFAAPYFPASSEFQPAEETAAAQEVRRLLGLHSDYGIRAVLAAVHGFPAVLEEFRDGSQTYRVSDFQPDGVVTTGATWKNDPSGLPVFLPRCTELPVPLALSVSYLSDARARIVYGARVEDVDVRTVFGTDDLLVAWPSDLGVAGAFSLDAAWQPGSRVIVQGPPSRYPWDAAGKLLRVTAVQEVLQTAGLLGLAHPLNNPVERIAVIALALAKHHPSFDV